MKKIVLLISLLFLEFTVNASVLYSIEQVNETTKKLVSFSTDSSDSTVHVISSISGLPNNYHPSAYMDFSSTGRLFVVPYGNSLYEMNPLTGSILGSMYIDDNAIEGVAVDSSGYVYCAIEKGGNYGHIWQVDFDLQTQNIVADGYNTMDLDDIDFDGEGALIDSDINGSGNMYRVPLDGSSGEFIENFSTLNAGAMTFSDIDNCFYFLVESQGELWRLNWENGLPVGSPYFVKNIGTGNYIGLAAIPEPATLSLLCLGSALLSRKRA